MIAELQNPLIRGLACATLHPVLRSLLVFDASPAMLQTMAGLLAQMVRAVSGGKIVAPSEPKLGADHRIVTVQLGAVETEEELWGSLTLGHEVADRTVVWRSGLLTAGRDREARIVVIPDLTRLSLAASRACVMLMGSEVAHLERHGQSDRWQPQLYWLAGCDHRRTGALSTHLLDRFALRLSGGESQNSEQRVARLRDWLERLGQEQVLNKQAPPTLNWIGTDAPPLSSEIVSCLQQVKHSDPDVLPEARERVLDYLETTEGYSPRRDLALLRLARVHAQLEGAAQVNREEVDLAAEMIGLSLKPKPPETPLADAVKPDTGADDAQSQQASQAFDLSERPGREPVSPSIQREPVFESDTTKTLPSTPLPMGKASNPYPEDQAEPEREAGSLRLPARRFKSAALGRGAIIGVEPATIPQDLALVSTLLESAKYQKLRWKALLEKEEPPEWVRQLLLKRGENGHDPLILQSGDLRRYRRAAVPEQMLTLVLDYTCLKECSWQETLLPYLQWAYVERASVCLVQVGAGSSEDKLWAEKWEADNILVPRIQNRLECDRGRATPLAHGLDLALQTLRHALQHGRSAIQKAVLVVMSDGRGNIPLKVSQGIEDLPPLVGKRGIEDAFQVAQQIAALNGVESVVLNPQPKHYSDLPVKLAQVLGAKIAKIPPLKNWEVDW
jgi:magnesium chelatase subunit D